MYPEEIREILLDCWNPITMYPVKKMSWVRTKSRGQCYPTALLVKRVLGGKILRGLIMGEIHYWNKLPNGKQIDLTSDQYGGNGIDAVCTPTGERRNPNYNNKRFKILWHRWIRRVKLK